MDIQIGHKIFQDKDLKKTFIILSDLHLKISTSRRTTEKLLISSYEKSVQKVEVFPLWSNNEHMYLKGGTQRCA